MNRKPLCSERWARNYRRALNPCLKLQVVACEFSICLAVTAATALLITGAASAEPVTYGCEAESNGGPQTYVFDSDQLVVDVEGNSAELRIARTVGTSDLANWLFTNRPRIGDQPDVFTVQFSGGTTVGSGLYSGYPHSFRMTPDGVLTWTFLSDDGPSWKRWTCRR